MIFNNLLYQRKWRKEHPDYYKVYLKDYRHKKGISKNYKEPYPNKILSKKRSNQAYRRRVRVGGKLPKKRIQLVYEDNIKHYGTLTCYLCLKPIEFGKDNLEHKIPLSRGGTNEYNNLAIACGKCNVKKNNKTEKEYRKER